MKHEQLFIAITLLLVLLLSSSCKQDSAQSVDARFASFIVNPKASNIELFWKDDDGRVFKSIQNLKNEVEKKGKHLRFAMNGGMYERNNLPKGLLIQNQKTLNELDTKDGDGNFYLKPNGVFYLTIDNKAFITPTQDFKNDGDIKFATQSGPMLIIDGRINEQFIENSSNLNVRNGVCILPDNKVVFAMSRQETSFYEF
ncbi:MAG: phosphodiester glycosidase family protein, partial [Pyrinomonadaceae bacterium]